MHAPPLRAGWCARVPKSKSFVRAFAALLVGSFVSIALFSRSISGVVLCASGALVSLEMFAAAGRGERWWLLVFGTYMFCLFGASVGLGAVTLSNVDIDCANAAAPAACRAKAIVLGILLVLGTSGLGFLAVVSSLVAYGAWTDDGAAGDAADERRKLGG